MKGFPTREQVNRIKEQYPVGTIIEMTGDMEDPYHPIPNGMRGKVLAVDDIGSLLMKWDNGSSLSVLPYEDSFKVVPPEPEQLKFYMPLTASLHRANMDEPEELDGMDCVDYESEIATTLDYLQADIDLRSFYGADESLMKKLQSLHFTVKNVDEELMGVAECKITEELTPAEYGSLYRTIMNQLEHGVGLHLSETPIVLSGEELYVSLYQPDEDWSLLTEEDVERGQTHTSMGGMRL